MAWGPLLRDGGRISFDAPMNPGAAQCLAHGDPPIDPGSRPSEPQPPYLQNGETGSP